jgi:hypothetical protein
MLMVTLSADALANVSILFVFMRSISAMMEVYIVRTTTTSRDIQQYRR